MIIIRILSLILWLFLIPCCIGMIPMPWIPEKKRNPGVVWIAGYLIMLPLCWLATVPCVLFVKYDSFLVMARWFTALLAAAVLLGIFIGFRAYKKGKPVVPRPALDIGRMAWGERAVWLLFFALLAWQLYKAFTMASFDGDDAEYVAQSLVTWQSNTMYLIKPYTGGTTSLDIRHSLAVLPVWVAYIGRMTGLHTTILAHSVLPFVWIPLTYTVFYEVGKHLFQEKKECLPGFMALMALLQIFGNVSIFTNETFFLTRTWQGKAVAVSFVLPATVWLLFWIFDRRKGEKGTAAGMWALLALTNMTAGVCTSMIVFLNAVMIGAAAFWLAVVERKLGILVKAGLVCIPNGVYMLLYLFLHV